MIDDERILRRTAGAQADPAPRPAREAKQAKLIAHRSLLMLQRTSAQATSSDKRQEQEQSTHATRLY
jgi:hypothetical protein